MKIRRAVLPLLLALLLLLTSCAGDKPYAPPEWIESFDFAAENARVLTLVTTTGADDASLAELRTLMNRAAELPYYFFSSFYTGENKTELTDHARTARDFYQMMLKTQDNAWRWEDVALQTDRYIAALQATKAPLAEERWLPTFPQTPQSDPKQAVLACFFRAKRASEQKENIISVTFGGDIAFGQRPNADPATSFDASFNAHDGDLAYPLSLLSAYLRNDSFSVANCEGALTNLTEAEDEVGALRGSPGYAGMFSAGGIEAVSVANEYTTNYFTTGYNDTLSNLEQAGVDTFGGTKTLLREADGVQLGFLAYDLTEREPENISAELQHAVTALRGQGAQLVVCAFHWGDELQPAASEQQTRVARLAVDAGADMVVGHHPHVLQGMEIYNGKPIVYSLGGLVLDNASPITDQTGYSMLVRQTWQKNKDGSLTPLLTTVLPVYATSGGETNNFTPYPLFGDPASHVVRLIFKLSRTMENGVKELASIG